LAEASASLSPSKPLVSSSTVGSCWRARNWSFPGIAEVPVEAVVAVVRADEVLGVHGAAEELEAVVERVVDHDVLDRGLVADAREGEAVDLVVHRELDAAELDADVAEDAGVVVRLDRRRTGCRGSRRCPPRRPCRPPR
jgi:hypothetical protein